MTIAELILKAQRIDDEFSFYPIDKIALIRLAESHERMRRVMLQISKLLAEWIPNCEEVGRLAKDALREAPE